MLTYTQNVECICRIKTEMLKLIFREIESKRYTIDEIVLSSLGFVSFDFIRRLESDDGPRVPYSSVTSDLLSDYRRRIS